MMILKNVKPKLENSSGNNRELQCSMKSVGLALPHPHTESEVVGQEYLGLLPLHDYFVSDFRTCNE